MNWSIVPLLDLSGSLPPKNHVEWKCCAVWFHSTSGLRGRGRTDGPEAGRASGLLAHGKLHPILNSAAFCTLGGRQDESKYK